MDFSLTTAVLSAELLEEKVGPMGPCENAGQLDEVPVVVAHTDDEDDEEEEDDFDDEEEDDEEE